ncbi:uncharacterized protein L203_105611 [Cryptococcus depauperatus CBS 7841]|uniref:NADH dehydrogenase [ubiquinone] iron-sulfur protein 4, mitochondrial n=1 Tax=Cryptococcus depauperatus CBS 7841 TaxID=1295531 RepID=A0A1E3IF19_9TREE|nr:hypothetical protein L203_03486 [Cryptococcus depauperatus CBS 7841]
MRSIRPSLQAALANALSKRSLSASAVVSNFCTNGSQSDLVSGAPPELLHRPVRIYPLTKSTMQSAEGKTKRWMVDWNVLQGSGRWEDRLMGWTSSADYIQGTSLAFRSEKAVYFVEKQGWRYKIDEPKKIRIPPKNYANNYAHVPGKLGIHHTK